MDSRHECIVLLKQERAFSKMLPQSWKHIILWNSIVWWSNETSPELEQMAPAQTKENSPKPEECKRIPNGVYFWPCCCYLCLIYGIAFVFSMSISKQRSIFMGGCLENRKCYSGRTKKVYESTFVNGFVNGCSCCPCKCHNNVSTVYCGMPGTQALPSSQAIFSCEWASSPLLR